MSVLNVAYNITYDGNGVATMARAVAADDGAGSSVPDGSGSLNPPSGAMDIFHDFIRVSNNKLYVGTGPKSSAASPPPYWHEVTGNPLFIYFKFRSDILRIINARDSNNPPVTYPGGTGGADPGGTSILEEPIVVGTSLASEQFEFEAKKQYSALLQATNCRAVYIFGRWYCI